VPELDDTDLEILSLLAADARRPFSEIGTEVDLSGPAVSDRVSRLEEIGIIEHFTIDVDRSQLRAGVPVLITVEVADGSADELRRRLRDAEAVEHVFVTADSDIVFYARVQSGNVRSWIQSLLDGEDTTYSVTLVDEHEWTPSIDGIEFALTCVECGNTVDSEGETARVDGATYHFCCPSCRSRFQDRYDRLEEGV